jgi:hypothetical protein
VPYTASMAIADDHDAHRRALADALATLVDAHRTALSVVESISDRQAALAATSQIANELRMAYEEATELRNKIAYQIWKTEELSLAALATRIGVSKARADQIVRAVKSDESPGVEQ